MKRCPECRKDYLDDTLLYCLDDGAVLVRGTVSDEPATAILSGDRSSDEHLTAELTKARSNSVTLRLPAFLSRDRLPWIAVAGLLIAFLAAMPFAAMYFRGPATGDLLPISFTITPPEKSTGLTQLAISPDGRNIVFVTAVEGKTQLWLRPLNSLSARPLPGTEGFGGFPFWSPDGRSIAFVSGNKLKRIDLAEGTVQILCDAPTDRRGFDGSWNREGVILFFVGGSGIYKVPATGGTPEILPGFEKTTGDVLQRWPQFLPDGRHFLYLETTAQKETSEVFVGSIDGSEPKRLLSADSSARYSPSPGGGGHILFSRDNALLAQRFDADSLTLTGEAFRVADQIRVNTNSRAFFSVSDNGTLIYDPNSELENRQLAWFDRTGKQLESIGPVGSYLRAKLSPDQKRIAVSRRDPLTRVFDIYVYEIARGTISRLTNSKSDIDSFAWSPDGNYIAWSSRQLAKSEMYRKLASGAGEVEVLARSDNPTTVTDWSDDGKFILYTDSDPVTNHNIWALPLEGDRKPVPFFQSPQEDVGAAFSPDGRFIAYRSRESGTFESYVQTFPASGGKWPISTNGSHSPFWRSDGRELFFTAADGKLMAVDVKPGSTFDPGVPVPLFDIAAARTIPSLDFDVTADGQRFLFISRTADADSSIAVMVNWTAEFKK